MANDLRTAILTWFVDRDAKGSQTSHQDRAIPRVVEELSASIEAPPEALTAEVKRLRDEGLIQSRPGEGPYRGACVTSITQIGRDRLFNQNDIGALVAALEELASALRQHTTGSEIATAATIDEAIKDAAGIKSSTSRLVTGLKSASATVKSVAAVKPAWSAVISALDHLNIHELDNLL